MAEIPRIKPLSQLTHQHVNRMITDLNQVLSRMAQRIGAPGIGGIVSAADFDARVQSIIDTTIAQTTSEVDSGSQSPIGGVGGSNPTSGAGGGSEETAQSILEGAIPTSPPPDVMTTSQLGTTTNPVQFSLADHTHGGIRGIRKNDGGAEFDRRRFDLIEGAGISITLADDPANDETDITIAATGTSADLLIRHVAGLVPKGDWSTIQPVQGTYGSSALVPVIKVDRRGRIESVTNVAITATSSDLLIRHVAGLVPKGDMTSKHPVQGTYGSASQVAQVTVDRVGRVTSVSNVAITGSSDFAFRRSALLMGG